MGKFKGVLIRIEEYRKWKKKKNCRNMVIGNRLHECYGKYKTLADNKYPEINPLNIEKESFIDNMSEMYMDIIDKVFKDEVKRDTYKGLYSNDPPIAHPCDDCSWYKYSHMRPGLSGIQDHIYKCTHPERDKKDKCPLL